MASLSLLRGETYINMRTFLTHILMGALFVLFWFRHNFFIWSLFMLCWRKCWVHLLFGSYSCLYEGREVDRNVVNYWSIIIMKITYGVSFSCYVTVKPSVLISPIVSTTHFHWHISNPMHYSKNVSYSSLSWWKHCSWSVTWARVWLVPCLTIVERVCTHLFSGNYSLLKLMFLITNVIPLG